MTRAMEAWDRIQTAIASGEPVAILVSPEIYHDQLEFLQGVNSAYVSTAPEDARLPWIGIAGLPVMVDPNLEPDTFALVNSRDFVDDMRIALDIVTEGMVDSVYKVKYGGMWDD